MFSSGIQDMLCWVTCTKREVNNQTKKCYSSILMNEQQEFNEESYL